MEKTITSFKDYLAQLGYQKSTVQMLPRCVLTFLNYIQKELDQIESKDILKFHRYLHEQPLKNREGAMSEQYIHHHIYALKTFFNWLEMNQEISCNPISNLTFKTPKRNIREPLTKEEIKLLFESCETQKERTILHLFYSCGLRRSEAIELNSRDIHFRDQLLYVRHGKGAKRRVVPLTQKVAEELKSYYLEERLHQTNVKEEKAFILNSYGKRAGGSIYDKLLKKVVEQSELIKNITPHYLRHSIATHLLENGLSIEFVRDFLGHKHLETTQIYAKVSQQQLNSL